MHTGIGQGFEFIIRDLAINPYDLRLGESRKKQGQQQQKLVRNCETHNGQISMFTLVFKSKELLIEYVLTK